MRQSFLQYRAAAHDTFRLDLLALCLFALPLCCSAQATSDKHEGSATPEASSTATENSEVPQVPGLSGLLRGLNGGLTLSGFHDAATGWATILQPAIGYSFNDIFAVDVTVPIFVYRLAETRAANPRPNAQLVPRRAQPGDVVFALHAQFVPKSFGYEATLSATAPTGDHLYGLTSGRSTFDLSNRFDRNFRHVSPSVELGVGDSNTFVNRLVTKNFTSLGPLAHFQLGAAVPLFGGLSFEADAFEQLPIGDQKVYTSTTRRGVTTTVVSGRNATEDNGFTTSLDIPLDRHTTVSAYYNRSLRLHDDTVSLALTYVLRGSPRKEHRTASSISPDEVEENALAAAQKTLEEEATAPGAAHQASAGHPQPKQ